MDQGNRLWVLPGRFVLAYNLDDETGKFFANAALPFKFEAFHEDKRSVFMRSWRQINSTFVQRLQLVNPIKDTNEGYQNEWNWLQRLTSEWYSNPARNDTNATNADDATFPDSEFFVSDAFFSHPSPGSIYMYDAVMAIGVGACKALASMRPPTPPVGAGKSTTEGLPSPKRVMTGTMLQEGIRSSRFKGASGEVRFGEPASPGSRTGETVTLCTATYYPDGVSG